MITQRQKAIELYKTSPEKALLLCKKWSDLGDNKAQIVRGAECLVSGDFYKQLGYNPASEISNAIKLLGNHLGV